MNLVLYLWVFIALVMGCSQLDPEIVPSAPTTPASEPLATPNAPEPTDTRVPGAIQQPSPVPVESANQSASETPAQVDSSGGSAHLASISLSDEPPKRDLFALAHKLGKVPASEMPVARVVNPEPVSYQEGRVDSFFVTDLVDNETYTIEATLKVVSDNAYWYADNSIDLSENDLRDAAEVFEEEIRPIIVENFGDIWSPGVDNDPHLTVLHTPLRAADGYFGSSDEYPRATHKRSNEREIIYMDGSRLKPGNSHYLSVLAHEFLHAVHWNQDAGEDAWVNEGLAEVAKELAGYRSSFVNAFLRNANSQLNYWPDALGTSAPHYGGSTLFLSYMAQRYGGYEGLKQLVQEAADGVNGVEAYLSAFNTDFTSVFKDWVIANYLDEDEGIYSYQNRNVRVQSVRPVFDYGEETGKVSQFAAQYLDLVLDDGDARITFQGNTTVPQVNIQCYSGNYCWWSNFGDSIDSTLTREFDLTGLSEATLEFWTWYNIEEDWDYAYVAVSIDDGESWALLQGRHTTVSNPVGNNFGVGITGKSENWVKESINLSPYSGGKVLVRFEYITDDAVNIDGLVVDDIAIPELNYFDDVEGENGGWQAKGFRRIDNVLSQDFFVQVIEIDDDGEAAVRDMTLNEARKGEMLVEGFGSELEHAVVVVTPVTKETYQPADYTLSIERADP